jgi:hypothetical protein
VSGRARVAPPQYRPERFLADVDELVRRRRIELVVPCFEEVFYLARHLRELPVAVFASELDVLAELHDKARFERLARSLGIRTPHTTEVDSRPALARAMTHYGRYIARPACSRGALDVMTNAGPRRGELDLDDCDPTPGRPWIVQEYIDGLDLCSFSVAHEGRVVAHCTYFHPLEIEHGGGIVFESVVDPETLQIVRCIVEKTGYHGQIGMDFRRDRRGLCLLECNPRPTAGVHLTSDELLVDAVTRPSHGPPRVVPGGVRRKYASAVLRDMVLHLGHLRTDASYLVSQKIAEVYGEEGDWQPALYQALSYLHVLWYRAHRSDGPHGPSLVAAYFDGIVWDGQAIP